MATEPAQPAPFNETETASFWSNTLYTTPDTATPTPSLNTQHQATQRNATQRNATPRHATPRHSTPRQATPHHTTPHHTIHTDSLPTDARHCKPRTTPQHTSHEIPSPQTFIAHHTANIPQEDPAESKFDVRLWSGKRGRRLHTRRRSLLRGLNAQPDMMAVVMEVVMTACVRVLIASQSASVH